MTNDEIIERVLDDEGRGEFTDDPDDAGGATKWGITGLALEDYWNHAPTREQIAGLTHEDAVGFYRWLLSKSKIDKIQNDTLRWFVFDAAVNAHHTSAIAMLQRALGVVPDGVIGPVTLSALPYRDVSKLCRLFLVEQMLHYGSLAKSKPMFVKGWLNRVARKMREVA